MTARPLSFGVRDTPRRRGRSSRRFASRNPRGGAAAGRAKRSLGQNFLIDRNLARKIVEAGGAGPGDPVLEIGPGRGALTSILADRGVRLIAVELDALLAEELAARFRRNERVRILRGDVLDPSLTRELSDWDRTRVIGCIPYNITTPILFRLLEAPRPLDIVLTVQKEVAERLTAPPGGKTYGALTVGVALHAKARTLFSVSRHAFRPVPRVESCVVRITPRHPSISREASRRARRLARAAFSWRRKQLRVILSRHPDLSGSRAAGVVWQAALDELEIPGEIRPEQLAPKTFLALAERMKPSK